MDHSQANIRFSFDATNPGQFFACCGLLEVAHRLWGSAEGWFEKHHFCMQAKGDLPELLAAVQATQYQAVESGDEDEDVGDHGIVEPLVITAPYAIQLDWWQDKGLKTWAGSMKVGLIAAAMSYAIDPNNPNPLNQAQIVFSPPEASAASGKKRKSRVDKREPFCFDARRGVNSHSLDIGFSLNVLKFKTTAYPAVEFLTLIGLQRCRPASDGQPRTFTYHTWTSSCETPLLPAVVNGLIPDPNSTRYRFENGFRSGKRMHKAFRPAILLPHGV